MGISAYVINAISAVIAVEYIDYGFPKKYGGFRRWAAFAAGAAVCFLTVTALDRMIGFEGVQGFFCGAVLIVYGMLALKGKPHDFLAAALLWILITIIGNYGIISVIGLLTGNRLGRYQKEKIEAQHRLEGLADMYRACREINHWRHDMQGELDVLYRMQKNGKYAEVEAHMERLCSGLRGCPELPQPTGNEGLDAALMKMIPGCRERGIRFCYVIMGKPGRIDSIALGNILDNLLCNGMEACRNLTGSREMELVIRSRMDGLEIYLENSIGESVLEKNPRFVSHKRDKEQHGFGMESISRIVEEHEGTYECWEEKKEEGSRFCQRIYLNYIQQ